MDITVPGITYAKCEVVYVGRATSTLEVGNYLIIIKSDSSIAVHGASFAHKPLNYQNAGAKLELLKSGHEFDDIWTNSFTKKPRVVIRATNKKEALFIGIHRIYSHHALPSWTDAKIALTKSERDLVNQIFSKIGVYFKDIDVAIADMEVQTSYGNIDILMIDTAGIHHIVEVKRKMVSISGCGQISRYAKHYTERGITVRQYLAAPAISKNALIYCDRNDQKWVEVHFD